MQDKIFNRVFRLIQLAVFAVFLGRAWQHIYWDAPYRALLWDQSLMEGFIQVVFGLDWDQYVSSSKIHHNITLLTKGLGYFYLICAFSALFIKNYPKIVRPFLIAGTLSLIFLAGLYFKEKFYALAQFWEYSLQWGAPILLLLLHKEQRLTNGLVLLMKIGVVLTFCSHGLYALGYYPRPGNFIEMTMNILSVNEKQAILFLNAAGIMDFVLSIFIFLPHRFALLGLIYATSWGLATTAARIWAYFHIEFWQEILLQWMHESIMRMPHFLIPLALVLITLQLIKWEQLTKRSP